MKPSPLRARASSVVVEPASGTGFGPEKSKNIVQLQVSRSLRSRRLINAEEVRPESKLEQFIRHKGKPCVGNSGRTIERKVLVEGPANHFMARQIPVRQPRIMFTMSGSNGLKSA